MTETEISKDELALYDRQIRLWGLEAQKKLREGSILIIGHYMNNIVQEICKNLALCGISSLTIRLISDRQPKYPLYTSLETELRDIHPNLKFECSITDDISNIDSFDFIITCAHHDKVKYSLINKISRECGKFSSLCYEYAGNFFLFNDFGNFTVNTKDGQKLFSFPSFDDVLNSAASSNLRRNNLHESFYESLSNSEGPEIDTDKVLEVTGSAIIGALVSQEVIKSFSKTDIPINNLMIFDSKNLKNIITKVGITS